LSVGIALIAGLGNPGPEYARTRHNAGYWFVDRIASSARLSFRREPKFHGEVCRWSEAAREIWLLKPLTYMNLSGESVAALARFYRIPAEQILVVHDELDLLPGIVRLKLGGGDGGHNGLSDIIEKLGTKDFYRLRVGIGHPGSRELVTPYLLQSGPSADDERLIAESLDQAVRELPRLIDGEFTRVMNHLNRRSRGDSSPDNTATPNV